MIKLKLTNLQENILRFLFINTGKSFNARGLAKRLNVSQPAISKALPSLQKENLIIVEKDQESRQLKIELNRDNPKVVGLKRADNLRMLYESGLVEFLEDKFPGSIIILFGSYSYGEDTINSDIDLAIIESKEKRINLDKFENLFAKKINVNFYDDFKNIHKNLKSNILNGVILIGRINL